MGCRKRLGLERLAGEGLDQCDNLVVGETGQGQPLGAGLAAQRRKHVGEGMIGGKLAVAIGPNDEQRCRWSGVDHVAEEKQRCLVGPLQVVQDKDNRRVGSDRFQQPDHRGVQRPAIGFGVA